MSDHEVQRTAMELRYRRVLRLLPPAYRAAYEEDMVTTFLASVDLADEEVADYGRPSPAERASVAALAVRLRLGGSGAAPRAAAWGHAVRLAVCTWLVVAAVSTATGLALYAWVAAAPGWLALPAEAAAATSGRWVSLADALGLGWAVALVALVAGQRVLARAAVAVALLPSVVGALTTAGELVAGRAPAAVLLWWVDLAVALAAAAGLAAFHREAPGVPVRPWLPVLGAGLAASPLLALGVLAQPLGPLQPLDWLGLTSAAVVVAGVLVLRDGARTATSPALLALALVGAGVLVLRTSSLAAALLGGPTPPALVASGAVQAAAVAVVALRAGRLAADRLRALPPIAPA